MVRLSLRRSGFLLLFRRVHVEDLERPAPLPILLQFGERFVAVVSFCRRRLLRFRAALSRSVEGLDELVDEEKHEIGGNIRSVT